VDGNVRLVWFRKREREMVGWCDEEWLAQLYYSLTNPFHTEDRLTDILPFLLSIHPLLIRPKKKLAGWPSFSTMSFNLVRIFYSEERKVSLVKYKFHVRNAHWFGSLLLANV
jgi:hypothetical protein